MTFVVSPFRFAWPREKNDLYEARTKIAVEKMMFKAYKLIVTLQKF